MKNPLAKIILQYSPRCWAKPMVLLGFIKHVVDQYTTLSMSNAAAAGLRAAQWREMRGDYGGDDDGPQQVVGNVDVPEILGCKTIDEMRSVLNPMAAARYIFVTLKGDQSNQELSDRFQWTIAPQGTARRQPSTIYLQELPSNLVAIKLTAAVVTFFDDGSDPYLRTANNGRIGLLLDECQVQASNVGQNRLHFMIKPLFSGYSHQDSNFCNYGAYWFNPPIFSLPRITISLFDPIDRIPPSAVEEFELGLEIVYLGGAMTANL